MFLSDLDQVPWHNVRNCEDVNEALRLWYNMLNEVVNRNIPKKLTRVRNTPAPWLSSDITKHMSTRDYLHHQAIRSGAKSDWDIYKSYRNKVTSMIRKGKESYYKNIIYKGTENSSKLWKALNDILPSKPYPNPSSIHINDNVLSSKCFVLAPLIRQG